MSTVDDALATLAGLVLESGHRWGEVATPEQWADARAVLDVTGPRRHLWLRSRGYSKSLDAGGVALSLMLASLPAGAECYVGAGDREQAAILRRKIGGLVSRTPEVRGLVEVGAWRVSVPARDVALDVISADAASSWGLTPALIVLDEVCMWGETEGPRTFFDALMTSLPKRVDSRALLISTPGSPSHWTRKVYDGACRDPRWRVSHLAGPPPWADRAEIEAERRNLPESTFRRLFLAEWVEGEDRLVREADLDAALVLDGPLPFRRGLRYVLTLDVGLVADRTVAVVAHAEGPPGPGRRVVVDRLRAWQGSRSHPVELAAVEAWLVEMSAAYGRARVVADPHQAALLLQRLRAKSVPAEQWDFTAASVGRLGAGLHVALRERTLVLPCDDQLRDELLHVRLREAVGGYRLDHDSGRHDDRAVAIALAVEALTGGGHGPAHTAVPQGRGIPSVIPREGIAGEIERAAWAPPVQPQRTWDRW